VQLTEIYRRGWTKKEIKQYSSSSQLLWAYAGILALNRQQLHPLLYFQIHHTEDCITCGIQKMLNKLRNSSEE
jgi:hypothetical protein